MGKGLLLEEIICIFPEGTPMEEICHFPKGKPMAGTLFMKIFDFMDKP